MALDKLHIEALSRQVLKYEEDAFKEKVQKVIPLRKLRDAAIQCGNSSNLTFHEHFIKEVMRWFKTEFFTWVNCKLCDLCGSPSQNGAPLTPTSEELAAGANRVEHHQCTACGRTQRFPRFNCPSKLLDTHEGRCGEWANCFTGICRALGYDARYVYDVTDHVWTEVFSPHLDRWVHMDACENAWDRPLMYEQGWKKCLSYVIAFSKDEIVDVTYRYTLNASEVRARRDEEARVICTISTTNKMYYKHSPGKKGLLTKRLAKEITSWLVKPTTGAEVYEGRESGSLQWRQNRGEGGSLDRATSGTQSRTPHVIQTGDAAHSFVLTYTPATDQYIAYRDGVQDQVYNSFESLVYTNDGVIKKVEYDWNMAYLARTANETQANIIWRVDCKEAIKSATINMSHATFETGQVTWACHAEGKSPTFHPQFSDIDLSNVVGCTSFFISAKMIGAGEEGNSWQHTQLFRTEIGASETPFYIELNF